MVKLYTDKVDPNEVAIKLLPGKQTQIIFTFFQTSDYVSKCVRERDAFNSSIVFHEILLVNIFAVLFLYLFAYCKIKYCSFYQIPFISEDMSL